MSSLNHLLPLSTWVKWEYLNQIPTEQRRVSQVSGLYRVRACWLLCLRTSLCAVRWLHASRAEMLVVVSSAGAAHCSLEVNIDGMTIMEWERLVNVLSRHGVEVVSCLKDGAFDNLVGVVAETYGAGRVTFAACAWCKILSLFWVLAVWCLTEMNQGYRSVPGVIGLLVITVTPIVGTACLCGKCLLVSLMF